MDALGTQCCQRLPPIELSKIVTCSFIKIVYVDNPCGLRVLATDHDKYVYYLGKYKMRQLRLRLVLIFARLLRVPIKIRDTWYGAYSVKG